MGYWVQVRRSWIQIHFKSEIIISKHETNSNDPHEICCAFHRAGQNANDKKKVKSLILTNASKQLEIGGTGEC